MKEVQSAWVFCWEWEELLHPFFCDANSQSDCDEDYDDEGDQESEFGKHDVVVEGDWRCQAWDDDEKQDLVSF